MKSPTAQTLNQLRKLGYMVQVVERWNAFAGKRQDLFSCIDVLACGPNMTVGIQATVTGSMNKRISKILDDPKVREKAQKWLKDSHRKLYVWGWAKRGPRGKRKVWTLKEAEITPEMVRDVKSTVPVE